MMIRVNSFFATCFVSHAARRRRISFYITHTGNVIQLQRLNLDPEVRIKKDNFRTAENWQIMWVSKRLIHELDNFLFLLIFFIFLFNLWKKSKKM